MDLRDVASNVEDQDRGRVLEILDPVTGANTGMKFRIAGPDSLTQHRAQLKLSDELAELMGPDGRVTAENRDRARVNCLARCILGWTIEEDGQPLPFSHANVVRVLGMAKWLQLQVDAFASDRIAFMRGAE